MGSHQIGVEGDHPIFIKGGFKMKQPNEPSPPQQVAYAVQAPTTNVRDDNQAIKENYSVKAATVLGVVHIMCGIIAFSCEIDVLVWTIGRIPPGTLGTGIWSSVFFFISGGLAIGGAQSGKKCLVVATLIMAIISAVSAGILLIMSAIFLPIHDYYSDYDNYPTGSYNYYNYYNVKNTVPSMSLLIAMGVTMLIVAIISAALTCKPLCCRSDDQRAVHSQPNQFNNQVNQGYNQPNQVNNQVHYQPNQETQFHYNQPNMVDPPPYQVYDQANQANQMNYSQPNYVNNQPNQFNNQPNQVQVHYQPNQTGDWKYGLCDCCNPCNLMCFYAFYCTPCAVYDMAEDLEEGSGILHLLLFLLFPPAPFIMLRGKARERSGIQGGFLGDCCTVTWCCGLDFIQTYKEVNPKESLLCGNERIV